MSIQINITDDVTHYKEWFKKMWLEVHGVPTKPASYKNLRIFEEAYGVKFVRDPTRGTLHATHYIEVEDESAAIMFMLKWP